MPSASLEGAGGGAAHATHSNGYIQAVLSRPHAWLPLPVPVSAASDEPLTGVMKASWEGNKVLAPGVCKQFLNACFSAGPRLVTN